MEDLETFSETSPQVSDTLEKSEMSDRTASILIKGSKSRGMTKSVSFSVLDHNKFINNETMESITNNTESDSFKKTYFNILSGNDETRKSNQSNNLSVNIIPQQSSDISRRSTELEHIIEPDKEPILKYFGWDGYEARFEGSSDHDSREPVPQCIPPWAKTLRTKYGVSPSSSFSHEYQSKDNRNVQDRIKNLMDKYSDLMLVKRVESKKQVIVEQGKYHDDIDTVKARAKHTRYYIAPISKGDVKKYQEDDGDKPYTNLIQTSSFHSGNMSLTKKISKTQAKREVHGIIQPFSKHEQDYGNTETKDQRKCQKLSMKDIREYVNAQSMTPDQRNLQEIIKIETVPRINHEIKDKVGSKYIINVPQNKPGEGATVNVIKIKEKRKLRVESLEEVSEKITELRYSERTPPKQENTTLSRLSHQENKGKTIGKTVKSPTETKTFQVTSKTTPHITPFVEEQINKTDKVLLIQYEKKSPKHKSKDIGPTQSKYTTKLLGVRRPASGETEEMYLYEAETCGEKQRENTAKVEGEADTLKEKLNAIFDELRGLSPKTGMLPETSSYSDVQIKPDQSDHSSQRPSLPIGTDVVSVQAMPEMKSVEVQVRQSQIVSPDSLIIAPHPSPMSEYTPDKLASTDERLEKAAKDLVTYADTESDTTDEKVIKKESFDDGEGKNKQFEDEKKPELDEDTFLDSDKYKENRQSGQSLNQQGEEIYKGTEGEEIYDELAYIEQVKEDEDKTDILPLVKSVTFFDGANDIDKLGISPEVTDIGDKLEIIQDSSKDEVKYDKSEVLSDMKEPDISEDEIFGQKQSLDPFMDQQTNDDEVITKLFKESVTSTKKEKPEEYHKRRDTKYYKQDMQPLSLGDSDSLHDSHKDSGSHDAVTVADTLAIKIDDDIRSYNLDGYKDTELTFQSSSKFLHKRDSIRKRLNWSDDTLYLEKHVCPHLIRGLAETAMCRPTNPIEFLAHWIYKDYRNREQAEQEAVHQEHRQLERTMCDLQRPDALVHKKFNLKKYPFKKVPSITSEQVPHISFKDRQVPLITSEKDLIISFKDSLQNEK